MGNSEKSKFSESQLYQMRCQVIAYKLLAMQEPVPKGLMEATQGKNNQQQQQGENTAGNNAPPQQQPKQGGKFKFN